MCSSPRVHIRTSSLFCQTQLMPLRDPKQLHSKHNEKWESVRETPNTLGRSIAGPRHKEKDYKKKNRSKQPSSFSLHPAKPTSTRWGISQCLKETGETRFTEESGAMVQKTTHTYTHSSISDSENQRKINRCDNRKSSWWASWPLYIKHKLSG